MLKRLSTRGETTYRRRMPRSPRSPRTTLASKPARSSRPTFRECTLADLRIRDERSFRQVPLYAALKNVLVSSGYRFRVLPEAWTGRWDRALLLNLTFWGASDGEEGAGDVLVDESIDADVVTHVAWHHLARKALGIDGSPVSADALFLGEAIASAFDLYLVGRLLAGAKTSPYLESQLPRIAEFASGAGLAEEEFTAMLESIAEDPARAFEDLRALLFDTSRALFAAEDMKGALGVLASAEPRRFSELLGHYELSNWVLYALAYAKKSRRVDARVEAVDAALRSAPASIDWLTAQWVLPAQAV